MAAPQTLIEHFSKLEDPRVDRNKKHELIDVIVLCVCAVVSGANGWSDIEEFGHAKLDWLRRYVPLTNGVPVDDTIARIISALSVTGFQECFRNWIDDVVTLSDGEIVAVDGKTHRRSHDRSRSVKALHMVSAWASRNGVVLGQVKTQEKSNEITAVPELLKVLDLKGCIPYRFYKLILLRRGLESVKVVMHFLFDTRVRIDRQHPFVARTSQASDSTQQLVPYRAKLAEYPKR